MKAVFSAVIAVILLAIYVVLVIYAIRVASCITDSGCTALTEAHFKDRMASTLALIGGLVSALVIAELAITKTGEMPAARLMSANPAARTKQIIQIITGMYLVVWLVAGLSAFIFGYLTLEPDVLPPLADLGQAWLGIAVGAAYAYFGINDA